MQKADALMRTNRNLGGAGAPEDIPVLTDIVIAGDATVLRHDQPPPIPRAETRSDMPSDVRAAAPAASGSDESARLADEPARQAAQREQDQRELAESVYFEVLRDLDVDTVDGMRERLKAQLMPVFELMARDLVIRMEQALADAIREQVGAAIERRLRMPPRSES